MRASSRVGRAVVGATRPCSVARPEPRGAVPPVWRARACPSRASAIAGGQEEARRLVAKSPTGELQHCCRRSIEPLHIVHRKHDRPRRSEGRNTPSRATANVCCSGGGPPESRRRSAVSSARRWGPGSPGSTSSSTFASRSLTPLYVNVASFSAGLAPERVGQLACSLHPGAQQSRLADSGLTLKQESPWESLRRLEKRNDGGELLVPANYLGERGGHAGT